MKKPTSKNNCVLAIALSTRGFGFAVAEAPGTLVDWGVKMVKGEKNSRSREKIEEMICLYHPKTMVLEDSSAEGSRRSERIRILTKQVIALAAMYELRVILYSREQVMEVLVGNARGTRHACAAFLAARFPEELGSRLPPKRRPWMSQDHRMSMFDAVALSVVPFSKPKQFS